MAQPRYYTAPPAYVVPEPVVYRTASLLLDLRPAGVGRLARCMGASSHSSM